MRLGFAPLLLLLPTFACGGAGEHATGATGPSQPIGDDVEAPATALEPFASPAGIHRFERAEAKVDFFTLANQFEGQQHAGMCGPTTAVIVLNALRPDDDSRPVDPSAFPAEYEAKLPPLPPGFELRFHRYSQRTFFSDPRITAVKSEAAFYGEPAPGGQPDPGVQLRQEAGFLAALGLAVTVRVVDETGKLAAIRDELRDNLGRAGDYVIVNYDRKVVGQKGGGHISPLAAYDATSDSFLVLDVNPNHGKAWAWVPTAMLVAAMNTQDTTEHRGYLLVSEPAAK